jgi:hypothetical protein
MTFRPDGPSLYGLIQASADSDALAEEIGLIPAIEQIGLSFEDVKYVAEQRALRALYVSTGREDQLREWANGTEDFPAVDLDPEERNQVKLLTACYLDGITLGARWAQRRTGDFGIGKDTLRS